MRISPAALQPQQLSSITWGLKSPPQPLLSRERHQRQQLLIGKDMLITYRK